METETFSAEVNRIFQSLMPKAPRWRYFSRPGSMDRYFYTLEKINCYGKLRYVAGIYRYMKTKKQWKMVKKCGFAKKYKAKEAALAYKAKEVALIESGFKRKGDYPLTTGN